MTRSGKHLRSEILAVPLAARAAKEMVNAGSSQRVLPTQSMLASLRSWGAIDLVPAESAAILGDACAKWHLMLKYPSMV